MIWPAARLPRQKLVRRKEAARTCEVALKSLYKRANQGGDIEECPRIALFLSITLQYHSPPRVMINSSLANVQWVHHDYCLVLAKDVADSMCPPKNSTVVFQAVHSIMFTIAAALSFCLLCWHYFPPVWGTRKGNFQEEIGEFFRYASMQQYSTKLAAVSHIYYPCGGNAHKGNLWT